MSTNFRTILRVTNTTVQRPRALAAGHYLGIIKGHEFNTSSKKGTPFIRMLLTPQEETDDVPAGENHGIDFSKVELRKDFYLTPAALHRLGNALDAILGEDDRYYDERIPDLRDARVLFLVTVRDGEEGSNEKYNDVGAIVRA